MYKEEIEKMYDSFPDEEIFDASQTFDSFLVGDGSKQLMKKVGSKERTSSNQLTGIYSINDLKNKPVKSENYLEDIKDDLLDFSIDQHLVKNIEESFFTLKKNIFEKYEYLEEKSKEFAGRPVRERDLVLTDDDGYLLHYIQERGYSYINVIYALAQLSAYKDLGLTEVIFYCVDMCPLCTAFEGSCYNISDLISIFGSGQTFVHEGAECNFVPVFRNRVGSEFTITAYIGDVHYENLPIEFLDFVTEDFSDKIGKGFNVVFKDFSKLEDVSSDTVVFQRGSSLFVHNGYISCFSPLDFLKEWIEQGKVNRSIKTEEISQDHEVFYLNGKKVVELSGKYIDISTGEEVELFGNDEKNG